MSFLIGVLVVELRWFARLDFLMFGRSPEFYPLPDDGIDLFSSAAGDISVRAITTRSREESRITVGEMVVVVF